MQDDQNQQGGMPQPTPPTTTPPAGDPAPTNGGMGGPAPVEPPMPKPDEGGMGEPPAAPTPPPTTPSGDMGGNGTNGGTTPTA